MLVFYLIRQLKKSTKKPHKETCSGFDKFCTLKVCDRKIN